MKNIIETKKLTKKYKNNYAVKNVDIAIPEGKIYALLGRNGAGKTTLMKMMLKLISPTSGDINFSNSTDSNNFSRIGSIIETPGFYLNLTGFENLKILAKLRGGISDSDIEDALKMVGLHNEDKKVFSNYSLGMKQRLGIAAATMHNPALLILDEPMNGLDPISIAEMRTLLCELSRKRNISILISSHALSEVEQITDIAGIMNKGELIEEITIKELRDRGETLENHFLELIGGCEND